MSIFAPAARRVKPVAAKSPAQDTLRRALAVFARRLSELRTLRANRWELLADPEGHAEALDELAADMYAVRVAIAESRAALVAALTDAISASVPLGDSLIHAITRALSDTPKKGAR